MGVLGSLLTNEALRRYFDDLGFVTHSDTMLPLLRQAYKAACVSDITVFSRARRAPANKFWPPPFIPLTRSAAPIPS